MITYRKTQSGETERLISLWLRCFDEKEEAARLFFERNLPNLHGYAAVEDETIIAAVYLIDCTLCGKPAHYLCGAATLPEHRRRGVMSALIGYALDDAEKRGDCYSVLTPADEGLYRFYARLGYTEDCSVCRSEFSAIAGENRGGEPDLQQLQKCNIDKFLLWNNSFIKFAEEYYGCYGVKALKNRRVFALYESDDDNAEVFYAIYDSIKELKASLYSEGIKRFTLTGSALNPDFDGCEPQRCGMIKPLNGSESLNDVYIGLTLQ